MIHENDSVYFEILHDLMVREVVFLVTSVSLLVMKMLLLLLLLLDALDALFSNLVGEPPH